MACGSESSTDEEIDLGLPELRGDLFKWTNYIHGWQKRYVVLKDGVVSYYRSRETQALGCRGALSLTKAVIRCNQLDDCRFDIYVNDSVWYLRAHRNEDKEHWVRMLEVQKAAGYRRKSRMRSIGSSSSLVSSSSASKSSFKNYKGLEENLSEIETLRDILCTKIDTLVKYYDSVPMKSVESFVDVTDLKGESIVFKETADELLKCVSKCIQTISKRKEMWRRQLEKELWRSGRVKDPCHDKSSHVSSHHEEGPCNTLGDEEFYDAIEVSLDKMEEEATLPGRLKETFFQEPPISTVSPYNHPLWSEVDRVTKAEVHYASLGVDDGPWQLFADEGDMKMYRRKEEVNGNVVDPLRACHRVEGVTGREMCHYFFSPQYRSDWETNLEQMTLLEKISDDILVFLQVYKRIWPAAQRDALFWSRSVHTTDPKQSEGPGVWAVVNHSTQHQKYPQNTPKCIRLEITVCLYCQTVITPPKDAATQLTRNNISCKITYCSVINPSGWIPASAVRSVYKREYPKFLKRFTAYVADKTRDKPIMI